jgi:hypothetical protein
MAEIRMILHIFLAKVTKGMQTTGFNAVTILS